MSERVLFVDDEPNVLDAVRRTLRKEFEVQTCDDPRKALEVMDSEGPFAVIVSDMQMPGMNGAEFLEVVRNTKPDSVRVMLTGNADQDTAMQAVNRGAIFQFLTKPVDPDTLRSVLKAGLRQYQLVTAEKELLEKTLNGSIQVLAEVMSIANPDAFGRTDRIRNKVKQLAATLEVADSWELDMAASISQLGCIGIRPDVLEKVALGGELDREEEMEYLAHPLLAADLIARIPRLNGVAEIVLYQNKRFDGSGFPRDERSQDGIPFGARVLNVVLAYDELKVQGWTDPAIYENLSGRGGQFDPEVLKALADCLDGSSAEDIKRLSLEELRDGMVIHEDVKSDKGVLLVCQGQVVSETVRRHLMKFASAGALNGKVLVTIPSA